MRSPLQLGSLTSTATTTTGLVLATAAVLVGLLLRPSPQLAAVRHLPTPASTLPVLHNTLEIMFRHGGRIYDWLLEHCLRFEGRPWRMQLLGRPVTVIVSTPADVEHLLKTRFEDFVKGPYTSDVLFDVLGRGIFAVDGPRWAHQRKTASHLFSLHMLRDCMEASVREHCAVLAARLRRHARDREPVELKRLLDLFTMDVFTKIGFGVELGGLATISADARLPFLEAFERSSQTLLFRFQQPMWLWRLKRWLRVGRERQLRGDMAVINATVHEIIRRSMAQPEEPSSATAGKTLVRLFVDKTRGRDTDDALNDAGAATDAETGGDEVVVIRDMAINFLAAGRDTTSQSMAWFVLMMNRHPRVLARVRDELARELEGTPPSMIPTMEQAQRLVYLEAALRESLRLNPVVAISSRTAARDTTLADGTPIRAGTRVVFSNYALARLPWVWGPDAGTFRPERWLDADGKLRQVSPFVFPVFLAGPRTCLGMKFALMEMKITLAALLAEFDLVTRRDPGAYTYRPSVTMGVRGPLDVDVIRVTSEGR